MSSATAFVSEEALPGELADWGVSGLLDALSSPDLELPCRSGDADLWFAESPAELERAKQLCADCPVREACLAGALARREPWGVWGGEIFERGVVIARKRPRGRPRKNPVVESKPEHEGRSVAA
ncbi:WhiB family transcriptional regulator, redox-sensing transcriptional regulator [Amycolatopsis arida]|uniref:Transcriptional regulator WhiB n=1 Tax=Amycolatopsis arida TaxID=587909 RepID=A0A1I5MN32_9PSEU|nr:WhiB family transcriptional regulator [Amycolatopsis arida]TDX94144.1 WhiB family redox-sensing transcriptional regulator [Amycolatopsis arida]SFP11012.1 WhiB family transcriptional regulator, redox-sensing transcriptional regulator [Amycolatopsis arida]